jgi:hypothetical protein
VIDDHNAGMRQLLATAPQTAVLIEASERHPGNPIAALEVLNRTFSAEEIRRSLEAMGAEIEASRGPHARLLLAFQNILFMVRALQDSFYRVGLALAARTPQKVEPSGSMSSAAKKSTNPVHVFLGDLAGDYFPWFAGWRNIRNRVKSGSSASIVGPWGGPPDDYGISLNRVDGNGGLVIDGSAATRISDVTVAIDMSTRVVERLATEAKGLAPRAGDAQT